MIDNTVIVQSPGRINIIGEHTDYNDGFVLPAAIDKKAVFLLKKNGTDHSVNVIADNAGEAYSFDLKSFKPLKGGWQNYVMGVVHELQKLGANLTGFDGQFKGDVPIGGGMSSSAALECSLAYGLNELFKLGFDKWQLIKASQMAEHNFVGIKCGIMDQFASMMGKKERVMLLDCRTLEYKYFPLELGKHQLLLLNTNVSHSLASSEYNTRRSECEAGVTILKKQYPTIVNLRDVSLEQLMACKDLFQKTVLNRCHHVVSENARVIKATAAMQSGDIVKLGKHIYQSHYSLQNDYEVSCEELDFIVKHTEDKEYILGARMMGGGFGGCVIGIIEQDKCNAYIDEVSLAYRHKFSIDLTPYTVSIENGACEIDKY